MLLIALINTRTHILDTCFRFVETVVFFVYPHRRNRDTLYNILNIVYIYIYISNTTVRLYTYYVIYWFTHNTYNKYVDDDLQMTTGEETVNLNLTSTYLIIYKLCTLLTYLYLVIWLLLRCSILLLHSSCTVQVTLNLLSVRFSYLRSIMSYYIGANIKLFILLFNYT